MQKISNTFCPNKWDELNLNLNYNYAYGCCKATPMIYQHNHEEVINPQKQNLLSGIKDPSCNFCWDTEAAGGVSRRNKQLKKFDILTYQQYVTNTLPLNLLEINLGNSCNLQCAYCNPSFSSLWEADIKEKVYPIFADRHVYKIKQKNKKVLDNNIETLNNIPHTTLRLIGGEPLINGKFFEILELTTAKHIALTTNLMVDRPVLDRLLSYQYKFESMSIGCSLDSTKELAEFVRHGLNYDKFINNLIYLLDNAGRNTIVQINSILTNTTILTLNKFKTVPIALFKQYPNTFHWNISHCQTPRIHSLEALPDELKPDLISVITDITLQCAVVNSPMVISALGAIKFDAGIFKQFKYFIEEFENRKNTKLPQDIKDILYAQTK